MCVCIRRERGLSCPSGRVNSDDMYLVMSGEEINKKLKASIREFYRAISANLKPAEAMHTELMPVVTSKHSVHVQSVYNIMLTLSLPRVINFKFSLQPHQKYTITVSIKNLASLFR